MIGPEQPPPFRTFGIVHHRRSKSSLGAVSAGVGGVTCVYLCWSRYAEQSMALQQQAAQQKAALEQQAMQLSMEYQQKKAEEDMMQQQ